MLGLLRRSGLEDANDAPGGYQLLLLSLTGTATFSTANAKATESRFGGSEGAREIGSGD